MQRCNPAACGIIAWFDSASSQLRTQNKYSCFAAFPALNFAALTKDIQNVAENHQRYGKRRNLHKGFYARPPSGLFRYTLKVFIAIIVSENLRQNMGKLLNLLRKFPRLPVIGAEPAENLGRV